MKKFVKRQRSEESGAVPTVKWIATEAGAHAQAVREVIVVLDNVVEKCMIATSDICQALYLNTMLRVRDLTRCIESFKVKERCCCLVLVVKRPLNPPPKERSKG